MIKYRGGKSKEIPKIMWHIPRFTGRYIEPFFGGGALFFYLEPRQAIINDINDNTIKRLDSAQLLDEYKLTPMADGKSYSINIAGKDYQIKVNGLGINLLSKKNVSASRFQIKELEGLKDVSLNTRE